MSDSYVSWETNLYIHVWNHASISTFVLVEEDLRPDCKIKDDWKALMVIMNEDLVGRV